VFDVWQTASDLVDALDVTVQIWHILIRSLPPLLDTEHRPPGNVIDGRPGGPGFMPGPTIRMLCAT